MGTLAQIAQERMPQCQELGMVQGEGRFVILCCKERATGLRRVRRFATAIERDRAFSRWEQPNATCPTWERCCGDHLRITLED
jgi:hypothetical protein